jgi:hypothetical protein
MESYSNTFKINRVLNEKISFLLKPIQSQKTQYTINDIRSNFRSSPKSFFVYICHNRKIALEQTTGRVINCVGDNKKIIKFYHDEDQSFANASEISEELLHNPEDYIGMFCLAHTSRFKNRGKGQSDINKILTSLERIQYYEKVYIYFDEADEYSSIILKHMDTWCAFSKVENVCFVTATLQDSALLKKLGDIPPEHIIDLWDEGSYDPRYYKTYAEQMNEGNIKLMSKNVNLVNFVGECVCEFFATKPYTGHVYGFVPSNNKKASHFNLATEIVRVMGFHVAIINSDFKGIMFPDFHMENFEMQPGQEPWEYIKYMVEKCKIKILIVTGNQCIGRAITLQGPGLTFDFSILHDSIATIGDKLYQMDRAKGNILRYTNKWPITYCTKKTYDILYAREQLVITIGTDDSRVSVREKMKEITERIKLNDPDKLHQLFDTQEEAILFCKNTFNKKINYRSNNIAPVELQIEGKNPTAIEIVKRFWGLSNETKVRMIPTLDNKWCVYWRPSLFQK